MLGEFAMRLAVALPLVCLAAVAALLAVKRGWIRLPAFAGGFPSARLPAAAEALEIQAVKSLSPTARLAVVRFHGRLLLIGVSGHGISLLAEDSALVPAPAQPTEAEPRP
ncbi:flagellar biosynthetic protein FliO [Sandaracinobacter sp. RS1-74]|uniref:flagellar biosynthetic protein FliO n=1 Tax=Sandaracinobacteroides sayramensis TaxID=2913411 RepID=UPI001EDA7F60|nr:flagellar biosynthetic protein FliO [Sandaracinobacteroides sayramensis]MCG2841956.1 flagellar biosynthetic protein FliO [Sandaracinobacteroides sayramensis]